MENEKQKIKEETELRPLNTELYDEFSIQELEQRLETKPWLCGTYIECPQNSCNGDIDVNTSDAPATTEES